MGLIDFFRRNRDTSNQTRLYDPGFGLIQFDGGLWHGQVTICIVIWAGRAGPTDQQRALYSAMKQRVVELTAAIEEPLFIEYNTIRDYERIGYQKEGGEIAARFASDFPELRQPGDIWKIAHLDAVEIYGERYDFDLCYRFEMDWGDEEHWLSVAIKDWKVIEVKKEG